MSTLIQMVEELRKKVERLGANEGINYSSNVWAPTLTGFSANPSGVYRYVLIGKKCTLMVRQYTNGTSSGAGSALTISLPFAAATVANMVWLNFSVNVDGGAVKSGPVEILSAGTVAAVYPDIAYGTWAAGNKRCAFQITYEIG